MADYFVKPYDEDSKGRPIAFAVYFRADGMDCCVEDSAFYADSFHRGVEVARHLAEAYAKDLNEGIE